MTGQTERDPAYMSLTSHWLTFGADTDAISEVRVWKTRVKKKEINTSVPVNDRDQIKLKKMNHTQ